MIRQKYFQEQSRKLSESLAQSLAESATPLGDVKTSRQSEQKYTQLLQGFAFLSLGFYFFLGELFSAQQLLLFNFFVVNLNSAYEEMEVERDRLKKKCDQYDQYIRRMKVEYGRAKKHIET